MADVAREQVSVKRRRADNPKYRRIVPRGRVAIRRQFILKSRGIGRDWSGESGAATFVKYSRGGGAVLIPKVFQPAPGKSRRRRRGKAERRRRFYGSAYRPRTGALFPPPRLSSFLPLCRASSHAFRVIRSPPHYSSPLPLHAWIN